jgi:hypothetical protein
MAETLVPRCGMDWKPEMWGYPGQIYPRLQVTLKLLAGAKIYVMLLGYSCTMSESLE